jgi:CRISPR-associated protein Csx16
VSRHPGAIDWSRQNGFKVDQVVPHLNVAKVMESDVVIGTLPVNLAAEVCRRGGRYIHLSLEIPEAFRGRELTASDLDRFGACLREYVIEEKPLVHLP